jgi:type I restriction enzyme S subunit
MKLIELFPEISLNPACSKDIKQWILQLAIEGKLTKKWREENKSKLSLNAVIEKISVCNEIEVPFDFKIPSEWKYVKLGDICNLPYGKGLNTSELLNEGFDVFGANGIIGKYKTYHFEEEKLLISCRGAYSGKPNISPKKCFVTSNSIICDFLYDDLTFYKFYFFAIQAVPKEKIVTGSAQPQVTATNARNLILPLPGYKEQQAIVTIVEDLFKEVDELEAQAKERIELKRTYASVALKQLCEADTAAEWQQIVKVFPDIFNDKQTIKTLRENILQLAVQGKLTAKWRSSRASMPYAQELLDQIKAEKAQLIKEKKIKAEKPLTKIEADEIPFELPEGWVWTNVLDISLKITDGEHATPARTESGYKLISARNVTNEGIKLEKVDYVDESEFLRIRKRCDPQKGDILISCSGSVGRICLVDKDDEYCMVRSAALIKQHHNLTNGTFLVYALRSSFVQNQIIEKSRSTAQSNLFLGKIKELIFPLPPLQEQQIIVEKVNALMGLCDELEMEVEKREKLLGKLAIA